MYIFHLTTSCKHNLTSQSYNKIIHKKFEQS